MKEGGCANLYKPHEVFSLLIQDHNFSASDLVNIFLSYSSIDYHKKNEKHYIMYCKILFIHEHKRENECLTVK